MSSFDHLNIITAGRPIASGKSDTLGYNYIPDQNLAAL